MSKSALVAFALAFAVAGQSHAVPIPPAGIGGAAIGLFVDGDYYGLTSYLEMTPNGSGDYRFGGADGTPLVFGAGGLEFEIEGFLNPDPVVHYSLGISNDTAAPKSFDFIFTVPLAPPVTGPYTVQSLVSAGAVDRNDGVITVTHSVFPLLQRSFVDTDSDLLNGATALPVDVGPDYSGGLFPGYGAHSTPIVAGVPGTWNFLHVEISGTLSAGDLFSPSGSTEIFFTVPLPVTLPLVITGLIVLGWARRPRRR